MTDYLIIESRDALECRDTESTFALAADFAAAGNKVCVFLVQNAVLPARRGARSEAFAVALDAGVTVLADDFSLRERGIHGDELHRGITASPLETVIDALASGCRTFWH